MDSQSRTETTITPKFKHLDDIENQNNNNPHDNTYNTNNECSLHSSPVIEVDSEENQEFPSIEMARATTSDSSLAYHSAEMPRTNCDESQGFHSAEMHFYVKFIQAAQESAEIRGNRIFATWYNDRGEPSQSCTYQGIWEEAGVIANTLRNEWHLQKGDRVILCYNFGLHFFAVFLGCLRAGVVAVLVYPPVPPLTRSIPKMNKVIEDCEAKMVLCDSTVDGYRLLDMANPLSASSKLWPSIEFRVTSELVANGEALAENLAERASRLSSKFLASTTNWYKALSEHNTHRISFSSAYSFTDSDLHMSGAFGDNKTGGFVELGLQEDDVAFLQYTSGSTGDPKGVMVTFANLQANIDLINHGFTMGYEATGGIPEEIVGFSWLPQYHDLGLIYSGIARFVMGHRMHMMSPLSFIKNPLLWIKLLSRHKVSQCIAPNFAYQLVARKFQESKSKGVKEPIPGLDLSSIHHLSSGGEPIQVETKGKFEEAFLSYGLKKESWAAACYGLAEHVVGLCWVNLSRLGEDFHHEQFVAVGSRKTFAPGVVAKVVDRETGVELEDGHEGELWLCGPSVASGYWGKPKLTNEAFYGALSGDHHRYLKTGDMAFFKNDLMFICGRIKDLIIVNGQNFYPQDVEHAAQAASPAVRPGCIAAFASCETGPDSDLVVVFEIRQQSVLEAPQVCRAVAAHVKSTTGLSPGRVVAIPERTICKTTSGKIQRRATRTKLSTNGFHILGQQSNSIEAFLAFSNKVPKTLPPSISAAIKAITLDTGKLQNCFEELNLHRLSPLARAWSRQLKTTDELKAKCRTVVEAVEAYIPTFVQFCHFASQHGGIMRDGHSLLDLMVEAIHSGFVLEWATTTLASDLSLLKLKIEDDKAAEEALTCDLEFHEMPPEARHFAGSERSRDMLFGNVGTFGYLKARSAELLAKLHIDAYRSGSDLDIEAYQLDGLDSLSQNMLEAIWLDRSNGYLTNASAGMKVALGGTFSPYPEFGNEDFYHFYKSHNMAFCLTLDLPAKWLISKLLIPSFCTATGPNFVASRIISLHMVAQLSMRFLLSEERNQLTAKQAFTDEAVRALGRINEVWADQYLRDPEPIVQEKFAQNAESFLSRCDKIHSATLEAFVDQVGHDVESFDHVLQKCIGENKSYDNTWDELGVTSLLRLEVQSAVEKTFLVTLPPDWTTEFPTPRHLKAYVEEEKGMPFVRKMKPLQEMSQSKLSWEFVSFLQGIGILVLLSLFVLPIAPAYYFGSLASTDRTIEVLEVGGHYVKWLWLPFAIPAWMVCFTILVIISKWIVVGRYVEGSIQIPSLAYLRWWFVDRLVHMFEFWVGRFIKDSIVLWLVYVLLGARIHPTAKLDAFVREFDLVSIGPYVSLEHQLRCRKFGPWDKAGQGPSLRFRSITISSQATVRGVVSLGSTIGAQSFVQKLCVVEEGSIVPEKTVASGNPAFSVGISSPLHAVSSHVLPVHDHVLFEIIKMFWFMFELYHFYCGAFIGQILFNERLPTGWQFTPLLRWVLLICTSCVVSIVLSIILKWLLIGKRKPGQILSRSVFQLACDWIADYHFRVSTALFASVIYFSSFWNVILKLHGMDIDISSTIYLDSFPPSKMDLIRVQMSFVSAVTFDTVNGPENQCMATVVDESSLARNVHINPGVSITKTQIQPMTTVSASVSQDEFPAKYAFPRKSINIRLLSTEACYLIFVGLVFCSFMPSYKIYDLMVTDSAIVAVPALVVAMVVQTLVWMVLVRTIQDTQQLFGMLPSPYIPMYYVYAVASYSFSRWSMMPLLWGTPFFNLVARFLGASFEGRTLYFGDRMDEYNLQTFAANTIVDGGLIFGHSVIYHSFTIGPNLVSGVLHEGTYLAHTMKAKPAESGPWTALIGSVETEIKQDYDSETASVVHEV